MCRSDYVLSKEPWALRGEAPASPPLLDPHGSKPQDPPHVPPNPPGTDTTSDITFRHSGWAKDRERVARGLYAAHVSERRYWAFEQCGHSAWVMRSTEDPDRYCVRSDRCGDRFCKPCASERSRLVARNLLEYVQDRRIRFVTLTLRTATPDLSDEIDRLYDSFERLRRRQFWSQRVTGGAALLEVKWSPESARWHPHLHVLCEGSYIPQPLLSQEWHDCTGDSYIVDVRAVPSNDQTVRYVCKYATDPVDKGIYRQPALLAEAIKAFKGRRTCLTFGCWRGLKLTKTEDEGGWEIVSTLAAMIWHANNGTDQDAHQARQILAGIKVYSMHDGDVGAECSTGTDPPTASTYAVPF